MEARQEEGRWRKPNEREGANVKEKREGEGRADKEKQPENLRLKRWAIL